MRRFLAAFALTTAAACAGEPLPPPQASGPEASVAPLPSPPALRLPRTASPVRYAATLTMVPTARDFEGVIDIDLTFRESSSFLWLNATAMTVREAHIEVAGRTIAVRAAPSGDDFMGFSFAEPVPAGAARLHVSYRGEISDKDDRGVFKEQEDGASYVFSQFENIDARRAFPCFDEPSYKVPWQLTMRVREGDVALSNTASISETKEPLGMKAVRFAETKPLPSYLVAFAVGPFDLVDVGKVGATPLRIATPRGRASTAAYAAKVTPDLFKRVEAYFGVPYPYDKLDIVAVPHLVSFSAMENAGLITFLEGALLARPEENTSAFQRRFTVTAAHEIAHQWFGDLVTMEWWDDVWLNEAFASWMESRIVEQYKPDWRWELARSRSTTSAMRGDSLVSARRIRQSIDSKDDIQNAFDEITYSKGAAVIAMFESYVGQEKFRTGVAGYLQKHAHHNATSKDFLAAIDGVSAGTSAAFGTFLDQPGVPLVRFELDCAPLSKKKGPAVIRIQQRKYAPLGSTGGGSPQWTTPVCLRWGAGKTEGRACTLVDGEPKALAIESKTCPDWVMLNANDAGYYHAGYTGSSLASLFAKGLSKLTPAERASVIRDMSALVASGDLPLADALERVPDLAKNPDSEGVESALAVVDLVRETMVSPAAEPSFARFLQKTFGARARAIGWLPKSGEDDSIRLLRPHFVHTIADRGNDAALLAEARDLVDAWLDAHRPVAPDVIDWLLATVASRGDRKLFDRLRAEAKKTKDERRLAHLVRAMTAFRDPAIVRDSLEMFLDDGLDARVAFELLFQDARMADVTFDFVKRRYDAVVARMPGESRGELPAIFTGFCDEGRRADLEAFFDDRAGKLMGGPRNLAKALERIKLCTAQRNAHEASLAGFLKNHR